MSIQSEIDRIKSGIAAAYAAVADRGGVLPELQNSENLAAAVAGIPASAEDSPKIYGVSWADETSTAFTRTDDAAGFSNPVPAIGTADGSSPFDHIYPWCGMMRTTMGVNTVVAIPKYWVQVTMDPFTVRIAGKPLPGYQVSPAHRDRGDGAGERDVVYIGRYHCNASYQSRTGQNPMVSAAMAAFRTGIHNLGADYWQADYALQLTWLYLYLVEYASWDGQAVIGQGLVNTSAYTASGGTDGMIYHTGRAAGTDGQTAVQYRNIENPWGNIREWRDGIIFSGTNVRTYANPSKFASTYTTAGATTRSVKRPTSKGSITEYGQDTKDASFIFPSKVSLFGGTADIGYHEGATSARALSVGGAFGYGVGAGPFYFNTADAASATAADLGARLQILPSAA